jgi:putative endonuclease
MFWVYMLQCNDKSYYTGHTDNLEQRLAQHQNRAIPSCYTSARLPVQLVYSQECSTREEALAAEKQIQGWGRRKKEALIKGDWPAISMHASRRRANLPAT